MSQPSAILDLQKWGLSKGATNACDPTDATTPHGDCWGAGSVVVVVVGAGVVDAGNSHLPHLPPLTVNQELRM